MLDWTAPLALLGLAAVPLVWWLHRFRQAGEPTVTAALFLWPAAAAPGPGRVPEPVADPRWRLRAAVLSFAVLASAGPRWAGSGLAVTVWFDDSLSMQTADAGGTRTRRAADAVLAALADAGPGPFLVRSLTDPARTLLLTGGGGAGQGAELAAWASPAEGRLRLPDPVTLGPDSVHWLATDGADPDLTPWAERSPLARVFLVGEETENAAVVHLALRRAPGRADLLSGVVRVHNGGMGIAQRTLEVGVEGEAPVLRRPVEAGPGEGVSLAFELPARRGAEVRARLSPPDPLSRDDELSLSLEPLAPVALDVGASCSLGLRAALLAHPGLAPGLPAALRVACGPEAPGGEGPWLWFVGAGAPVPAEDPLVWLPEAGVAREVPLAAAWLRVLPQPPGFGQGTPILLSGGRPLAEVLPGPGAGRRVAALLDLSWAETARRAEFPALVARLVELAAGRDLLDPLAVTGRPAAGVRIAPAPTLAAGRVGPADAGRRGTELSAFPLLLAIALLGLDLASVWSSGRKAVAAGGP